MIFTQWNWPGRIFSGVIVVTVMSAIQPLFSRPRESVRSHPCQSNLKQISLGLLQYCADFNDKMPYVTAATGWAEALQPYLRSKQIFICPNGRLTPQPKPRVTQYTDYFYNARVQGWEVENIDEPTQVIMLGDGNDGVDVTDASYAKTEIPLSWRTDQSSPAFRHNYRGNYAFLDGHVKAVPVEHITTDQKSSKYYFQLQKLQK
ncbi:DUF1559 domain-containing protein [bacterium]|nr:MAG: DUF1559 domain-containing protein [bacterium]